MKNLYIMLVVWVAGCGISVGEDELLSGIPGLSLDAFSVLEDVEDTDTVSAVLDDAESTADSTEDTDSADAGTDAALDGASDAEAGDGFPGIIPTLEAGTVIEIPSPGGLSIQPSIALDADLEFLLVFTGVAVNDNTLSIWAKREEGEPFPLHVPDDQKRNEPVVCALAGGGFVAIWSVDTDGNADPSLQIGYVIIGAGGPGPEMRVSTDREGNHWLGHVSCTADGGFVISGVRPEETDPSFEAFSMGYDAAGQPVSEAVTLNSAPEATETQPVVGATAGTQWTGWTTLAGDAWIRRAFSDEEPSQLSTTKSTGMAMGADYRIPGAVISVNTAGLKLQVHWLPEEGEPSEPVTLMDDGAVQRHTSALTMLERTEAAAIIYLTLEEPDSRVIVSYIGVQGSEPLTVGSGPLPPYAPSIAFRGGVLVAAWTEKGDPQQYTVRMQRW